MMTLWLQSIVVMLSSGATAANKATTPTPLRPSRNRTLKFHSCDTNTDFACMDGSSKLQVGHTCDQKCSSGSAIGPLVCYSDGKLKGPGCSGASSVSSSDVDAVPDANSLADMVYKDFNFGLVDESRCLLYPGLPANVKRFIVAQAGKYGPSAAAIMAATKLGKREKTEFFLSIEQVSILLAQTLCGATGHPAGQMKVLSLGANDQPQPFAFGRAMEFWYQSDDGTPRIADWRRTTLVGYGTFDTDTSLPLPESTVATGPLNLTSGCGTTSVADWALADRDVMDVVFAGHYVGGFMDGWYKANNYGAQEEKFGTVIPEMMLATDPLRMMGAGLLSDGARDPWLPQGGWYIIGAGAYVQGQYPFWTPSKVPLSDGDFFAVGNGRRMRRRGIVAIMGKPCNDRGSCRTNTNDPQYKCYNRQVEDKDLSPEGGKMANLWGIAGGAYNFLHWPAQTANLLQSVHATSTWVLQAGGWGAGAFGCGTLYGSMIQTLAAKKGGWRRMRMCFATKDDPYPSLESKLGFLVSDVDRLAEAKITHLENCQPLMTLVKHDCPTDILLRPSLINQAPLQGRRQRFTDLDNSYGDLQRVDVLQGNEFEDFSLPPNASPSRRHPREPSHKHQISIPIGSYCDTITFTDAQFGGVAAQLYKTIEQNITLSELSIPAPHKRISKDYEEHNNEPLLPWSCVPWWTGILAFGFVCVSSGAAFLACSDMWSSPRELDCASDLSPSTSDFSPPA